MKRVRGSQFALVTVEIEHEVVIHDVCVFDSEEEAQQAFCKYVLELFNEIDEACEWLENTVGDAYLTADKKALHQRYTSDFETMESIYYEMSGNLYNDVTFQYKINKV